MPSLSNLLTRSSTYWCVIAVGFGVGVFFTYENRKARRIENDYQATTCVVASADFEVLTSRSSGEIVGFRPLVKYGYQVDGREYTSTRYAHFNPVRTLGEVDAILERNHPGATRPCYFDPDAPEKAVIDRGIDKNYLVALLVTTCTLMFLGVGGWAFAEYYKRRTPVVRDYSLDLEPAPANDPLARTRALLQQAYSRHDSQRS